VFAVLLHSNSRGTDHKENSSSIIVGIIEQWLLLTKSLLSNGSIDHIMQVIQGNASSYWCAGQQENKVKLSNTHLHFGSCTTLFNLKNDNPL
jgi:hypothetical protein